MAGMVLERFLADEAATARLGEDLAMALRAGDAIALRGDLGAGKSTLARALIRALADDTGLEVPSPTFTLVQSYELPACPVLHADLYRVEDESELEEIGLSPLPEATLLLVEWPERAPRAFAADRIDIALTHRPALGSTARAADITGYGKAAATVARLQALRAFLAASGYLEATRRRMAGDASIRSYARLSRQDGIDLSIENDFTTAWGDLQLGANVTHILHYRQQGSATSPRLDVVDVPGQPADWRGRLNASLSNGPLTSSLSLNYTDNYTNPLAPEGQRKVDAWVTLDGYLSYAFGEGKRGPVLSLSVQNILDEDPPFLRPGSGSNIVYPVGFDPANANPLGRFVAVGLTHRW